MIREERLVVGSPSGTGRKAQICGAMTEWIIGPDGSHGKMITHHSLDGRELYERGPAR
jgi:hypothetical protein